MNYFEKEFIHSEHSYLAACDEVGRGPLAGPVVAATVYCSRINDVPQISHFLSAKGITDSKKLTPKKRALLLQDLGVKVSEIETGKIFALTVKDTFVLHFSVCEVSADSIDQINILRASLMAMKNSFALLQQNGFDGKQSEQGVLLVDGNKIPQDLPVGTDAHAIVKGDAKSSLIGLASILAKEYRDLLMKYYNDLYPGYGLDVHAGYGTKLHCDAIKKLGPSPIHRKTFKGVKEYL